MSDEGLSTGTIEDDIRQLLKAGLAEAAGGYRAEFESFVTEFGADLADLAIRAQMGDEAAQISLRNLKQIALTSAFIATRNAHAIAQDKFETVMGMLSRFLLSRVL